MISTRFITAGLLAFVSLRSDSIVLAASTPQIRFIRSITDSGGEALFRDPLQMSLNRETGELAVTNAGTGEVVVLRTKDERVLLRIGRRAGLSPPFGVALNADKSILAGELKGGKIKRFGPSGALVKTWDLSEATGHPVRPGRIRAHASNTLLVMDRQNDQVLILTRDAVVRSVIGGQKRLDQIQDAVFGPDGSLYTLCNGGTTVRVFTKEGKFLHGFGKHAGSPENFSFPCALTFDTRQRLWIVDAFQHKLKVFTKEGTFLFEFGGIGFAPMNFFFPSDIAFDDHGRLMVLEKGGNRIKLYDVEDLKR